MEKERERERERGAGKSKRITGARRRGNKSVLKTSSRK